MEQDNQKVKLPCSGYTADGARELLEAEIKKSGLTISGYCRVNKIYRSHAFEFLVGRRGPGTDILRALGLEKLVAYVEAKK